MYETNDVCTGWQLADGAHVGASFRGQCNVDLKLLVGAADATSQPTLFNKMPFLLAVAEACIVACMCITLPRVALHVDSGSCWRGRDQHSSRQRS
jgi:hypothetical protein